MNLYPSSLISCLLASAMFFSCNSSKEEKADAEVLMRKIARNAYDPDSVKAVRDIVSQSGNEGLRDELIRSVADSSDMVKASVLAITLLPDEIADSLINNPSRDFADNLRRAYSLLGDDKGLQGLAVSMIEKFNSLPADRKAEFVTAMGTPEECALAIERGDSVLVNEIRNIYSESPELLNRFNNALSSNLSITE